MFALKLFLKLLILVIIYRYIRNKSVHGSHHHDKDDDHLNKTIEEIAFDYEDDKNSMLAASNRESEELYENFYDEMDNTLNNDQASMNVIFFGDPMNFLRLDPESILHILTHTKTHLIPRSRALLAWDIITDGKTAAYLQYREFLAFGKLLNVVPEEDLYYVNFADSGVMKFFARHDLKLERRKLGILAAAYRRYYGNQWYNNASYINELGYLMCGFPAADLMMIPPKILKEVSWEAWTKIRTCSSEQLQVLYTIATHKDAYGILYTWSSHEVCRMGMLMSCIPDRDVTSIRLEAMSGLSENVLKDMDQEKLTYFTKEQILRMNSKARRIFMLRMQLKNSLDITQLTKKGSSMILPSTLVLLFSFFIINTIA